MAVVIPTCFENNFALEDGQQGDDLRQALKFQSDSVNNLYKHDNASGKFISSFTETGVAYNETEKTSLTSEATLDLSQPGGPSVTLEFEEIPIEKWGINFAGVVKVAHATGEKGVIYLPGTRTYDPAGLSGDPHASERIGPSCSRTQAGITLAGLMAALKGANLKQINILQEATRGAVLRYHGREVLFDWMRQQIEDVVYKKHDPIPYPEYIKQLVLSGKMALTEARQHTREYLKSYNISNARPPVHYYRKVGAKDDIKSLLTEDDYKKYQECVCSVDK